MHLKINPLNIGELKAKLPIIQGGMGIGVSRGNLAGAVAKEGAIGVISGVQIGYDEEDFKTNTLEANKRALRREIRKAKDISGGGIIGVNLLYAMNNYGELVEVCKEEAVDLIISGAGLPTDLPALIKGSKIKAVPIVSSLKALRVIFDIWKKRQNYIPDMVIVEGPKAGGHLGFKTEEDINNSSLEDILLEILEGIKPYEDIAHKKISVVVAGGIYEGSDVAKFLKLGADGVQMGTRFIATEECDASYEYKKAFINASKEDIVIVKSPVGLPGRAIKNEFIEKVISEKQPIDKCYKCLRKCDPAKIPYCITKALINAVEGNVKEGLIFTGSNGYRINSIISVKELLDEIVRGVELYNE